MSNSEYVSTSTLKGTLAVVILTYNEGANLEQALESICGWAHEVFVLDSFSQDNTLEIARKFGCHTEKNKFVNFAQQRNYALNCFPIKSEWILYLDADEWVPKELKNEISNLIASEPAENGFFLSWRLIWMGKWIKRGYYPTWILRLFRKGKVFCEDRSVNEHLIVEGKTGRLVNDFIHEDRKGVFEWIDKHNDRSTREALELFNTRSIPGYKEIDVNFFGTQAQRKRWIRYKIWNKLPPLVRPIFYFIYRYIITGGFLDGKKAFTYHFLHALWLPMLIDIKYIELKGKKKHEE